ncbi:MAG: 1-acyl-sn-glycerol-3-phosphate acyltransferase, partial [bacterium]|nr:1-acyl-sn-glycerol-3-phosphate acyltransferase [bacterium]
ANHQSTLDILVVIPLIDSGRFVAKRQILPYPVIGSAARYGGQIVIDRSDHRQSMRAIRHGIEVWPDSNLIFFAEGTRSRTGRLGEFKRGAFAIAVETGLPILPVAITGAFEALPKGSLLRLRRRPQVHIEFGEEIPPAGDAPDLAQRTRGVIASMIAHRDSPDVS